MSGLVLSKPVDLEDALVLQKILYFGNSYIKSSNNVCLSMSIVLTKFPVLANKISGRDMRIGTVLGTLGQVFFAMVLDFQSKFKRKNFFTEVFFKDVQQNRYVWNYGHTVCKSEFVTTKKCLILTKLLHFCLFFSCLYIQ